MTQRCQQFGELSTKDIRFCEEYVKDHNGAEAIRRLGIGNPKTAAQTAHKYLKRPEIKDYIEQLMTKTSEMCEVERNDLMNFWVTVMNDPNESTANRIKVSKLLGDAMGVFTLKVETQQAPQIIMDIGLPPAVEPLALEESYEVIEYTEVEDDS